MVLDIQTVHHILKNTAVQNVNKPFVYIMDLISTLILQPYFQIYIIYIYIYLIDLKICNPGILLNYNFYKIIQCSPDCNYLF
jgi:hypothetical protein